MRPGDVLLVGWGGAHPLRVHRGSQLAVFFGYSRSGLLMVSKYLRNAQRWTQPRPVALERILCGLPPALPAWMARALFAIDDATAALLFTRRKEGRLGHAWPSRKTRRDTRGND
jgi:hypothetical protein